MTDRFRLLRLLPGAALALALGPLAAQNASREPRNGDYIVAVVNNELVTAYEVEQRVAVLRAEAARNSAQLAADEALRKKVLDSLIDERVIVTYARDSGQKVDDVELDRTIASVAAQNQLTVEQLRERLRTEGTEFPRFRTSVRDQMLVERVREREVIARIRVNDGEIDQWLEKQRTESAREVELNLAQILVTVPEGADAAEVDVRRRRAEAAVARLRAGEDFAAVAREMSDDGNRERGGEVGLKPVSRLPDLFVEAVRDLQPGQTTSTPVRSGAGFHVLKLLQRQEGNVFQVTQTRARHILLRPSERGSTQSLVRRMQDIRRQIESGERKFEDLARELSEDGSASANGELGWAAPGQFVPEFEEAMNALAVSALSQPVVSRFGVHLIQVMERRQLNLQPKELREQARNVLKEQKFDQAFADWARELRQRAYIEMREPPQ